MIFYDQPYDNISSRGVQMQNKKVPETLISKITQHSDS